MAVEALVITLTPSQNQHRAANFCSVGKSSTTLEHPLYNRLPLDGQILEEADEILDRFLDYTSDIGLELYPAQEQAVLELLADNNVILSTPTGSGKSLVALASHFHALCADRRSVYTSPVKALVNEKFFDLCEAFHPDNVGLLTGDASVNRDAPILCCTAEVLANMALRQAEHLNVSDIVIDEFHFYGDRDRGVAWQIPLLTLPQARFLLMSATLGEVDFFEKSLSDLNGRTTITVSSDERPVPLDYHYAETALHETIDTLVTQNKVPIYVVNFTQKGCHDEAQNLMSVNILDKPAKKNIAAALKGFRFDTPYGKTLQRFVRHGVGIHHGGMLPKYRRLVERLAKKGLLKVISGTDTLGVGVNVPIRTVLLTKLCKFDGANTRILSVREFKQIAGRAGRRGYDNAGTVVAQAPAHVIENLKLAAKASNNPAKKRKMVKKKPPSRGYVAFNRATFEGLIAGKPEALSSHFRVSHSMLLNVIGRPEGGCAAMKQLLRTNHEKPSSKHRIAKTAISMFRSLVEANVISLVEVPGQFARRAVVNQELQQEFSLVHVLSLFVVDTLPRLDMQLESYPVDVLSIVEAILENPTIVMRKQLDAIKTEAIGQMKADGLDYDERMEELEKLSPPKPNAEFIYANFNDFAAQHPWVGTENIRPKGVARQIFDDCHDFRTFVKELKLERSEGVVLRYITDVYKALSQTIPPTARNEPLDDLIAFFGTLVRGVDSSLLDEWEQLRDPNYRPAPVAQDEPPPAPRGITADQRGFTVMVRNASFRLLQLLARGHYQQLSDSVETPAGQPSWSALRLEQAIAPFYHEHDHIRTDPAARGSNTLLIDKQDGKWHLQQILLDAEDHNDWVMEYEIDLSAADEAGHPPMKLMRLHNHG